ncbi:MAG: tetratricopeptide repeat protein [Gallionella sp.]
MSLLLDARKKSQQAQSQQGKDGSQSGIELSLESLPNPPPSSVAVAASADNSRIAGQNLFSAKSHASPLARAGINRNLLIALGGTILLFAAGAGYVWYTVSATHPSHPIESLAKPVLATTPPQNNLVPDIAPTQVVSSMPASSAQTRHASRSTVKLHRQAGNNIPMLVEQHQDEPIYPILNNAYLAYRSGKFEQAQQLYHEALKLDASNLDAILGLAVIAQRRGEDSLAAHYYAQALALDPRNAVANAGMSALTTGDNRESRLKTLLNEQPDSSTLYFALGNRYAEQARWGEAQQAYFNAYKLEPDNAELAFNLAISLDRLGQNKPAAQYYQRALQLDPNQSAGFDHKQVSQRIENLTH